MGDDLNAFLLAARITGKRIAMWYASPTSLRPIGLTLHPHYPPEGLDATLCWSPETGLVTGNPADTFVHSSGAWRERVIDPGKVAPNFFHANFAPSAPLAIRDKSAAPRPHSALDCEQSTGVT